MTHEIKSYVETNGKYCGSDPKCDCMIDEYGFLSATCSRHNTVLEMDCEKGTLEELGYLRAKECIKEFGE